VSVRVAILAGAVLSSADACTGPTGRLTLLKYVAL
jgi:hypothetical protein